MMSHRDALGIAVCATGWTAFFLVMLVVNFVPETEWFKLATCFFSLTISIVYWVRLARSGRPGFQIYTMAGITAFLLVLMWLFFAG